MSGVLVVGAGGHAKVVIATLRAAGLDVAGVLDDRTESWGRSVLGCPVLGGLEQLEQTSQTVPSLPSAATRRGVTLRPGFQTQNGHQPSIQQPPCMKA